MSTAATWARVAADIQKAIDKIKPGLPATTAYHHPRPE